MWYLFLQCIEGSRTVCWVYPIFSHLSPSCFHIRNHPVQSIGRPSVKEKRRSFCLFLCPRQVSLSLSLSFSLSFSVGYPCTNAPFIIAFTIQRSFYSWLFAHVLFRFSFFLFFFYSFAITVRTTRVDASSSRHRFLQCCTVLRTISGPACHYTDTLFRRLFFPFFFFSFLSFFLFQSVWFWLESKKKKKEEN